MTSRSFMVVVAITVAFGTGFAAFSVLNLFEEPVQLPMIDGEEQGAVPGVFGPEWEHLAAPLVFLSAIVGVKSVVKNSATEDSG